MQAAPNRTELEGIIRARRAHPEMPGYEALTLDVRGANQVEGQADLLSRHVGQSVEVAVRAGTLPEGALAGWTVKVVATLAGPGVIRADHLLTAAPPSP